MSNFSKCYLFIVLLSITSFSLEAAAPVNAQEHRNFAQNFVQNLTKYRSFIATISPLLHIPYVMTLDSQDARVVRAAGVAAMASVVGTLCSQFFSKCSADEIKGKVFVWDAPKFLGYTVACTYDWLNVLSSEHMVLERLQKADQISDIKIKQAVNLAFEFLLRLVACIARYKADNNAQAQADLNTVGFLVEELADLVELYRLLARYKTYSTTPGLDVSLNIEIKHAGDGFSGLIADGVDCFNRQASDDIDNQKAKEGV